MPLLHSQKNASAQIMQCNDAYVVGNLKKSSFRNFILVAFVKREHNVNFISSHVQKLNEIHTNYYGILHLLDIYYLNLRGKY